MKFGVQMRTERKKRELSAQNLAEACGVSRSYISLIENGNRLPSRIILPKIAQALGIKANVVVNWYLETVREKLQQNTYLPPSTQRVE